MLELRQVSRAFGAFTALDKVDLTVRAGEIVGLLGENGAGKSTLMNLVGGVLDPTGGQIIWDGQPVHFASPRDATQRGIGVAHQHFMLVPSFTVAENTALHATGTGALYDASEWNTRIQEWAALLGWKIEGQRRVADLSVGELQRVEILKALFANAAPTSAAPESSNSQLPPHGIARLLLLDEPTANLTPPEVEELFNVLRRLRTQQRGLVFVSHKLNEVLALCDRIVVLRHGQVVGERKANATSVEELASLMVGRELERVTTRSAPALATAPPRLIIENVVCGQLRDFSLSVRAGEIVGLAGVDGNGQRELVEVLSGLSLPQSGHFAIAEGGSLAVIPPDRQTVGLIQTFDLTENMTLHPALRAACRSRFGFDWAAARQKTRALMQEFDVRAPATGDKTHASQLSGGNQQKMVIARALSFPHGAVVAADPTRGLDIAAAQFVHQQLRQAAANGAAVLLISTDLDEVLQLSDRIGILYEGRLLPDARLLPSATPRETIGALMGGKIIEATNMM